MELLINTIYYNEIIYEIVKKNTIYYGNLLHQVIKRNNQYKNYFKN